MNVENTYSCMDNIKQKYKTNDICAKGMHTPCVALYPTRGMLISEGYLWFIIAFFSLQIIFYPITTWLLIANLPKEYRSEILLKEHISS
jgi:hypothetical protein